MTLPIPGRIRPPQQQIKKSVLLNLGNDEISRLPGPDRFCADIAAVQAPHEKETKVFARKQLNLTGDSNFSTQTMRTPSFVKVGGAILVSERAILKGNANIFCPAGKLGDVGISHTTRNIVPHIRKL